MTADDPQNAPEQPKPVEGTAPRPDAAANATSGDVKEKDDTIELLKAMAFAAIIALVIRSLLFEPFNIPSGSMFPTLLVGDYLFVEKWSYGYSMYSFPLDAIPFTGRIMAQPVTRGDVVVFRQPKKVGVDYIKRIIGLPGDTIQVREGRLYINGELVKRELQGTESLAEEGETHIFHKYIETLPNGVKHFIYEISDDEPLPDHTGVYKVPEGHYFAMGDNRDQSLDSRFQADVGYVPAENIIGKAQVIFFSEETPEDDCQREGVFGAIRSVGCKVIEWPQDVRYSRIFRSVSKL